MYCKLASDLWKTIRVFTWGKLHGSNGYNNPRELFYYRCYYRNSIPFTQHRYKKESRRPISRRDESPGLGNDPNSTELNLNRLSVVIQRARRCIHFGPFSLGFSTRSLSPPTQCGLPSSQINFFHSVLSSEPAIWGGYPSMCFGLIPHDHHAYREKKSHTGFAFERSKWMVPTSGSKVTELHQNWLLTHLSTPDEPWKGTIFSSDRLLFCFEPCSLLFPYSGPERLSSVQHFPLESFATWSILISRAPRLPMALIN